MYGVICAHFDHYGSPRSWYFGVLSVKDLGLTNSLIYVMLDVVFGSVFIVKARAAKGKSFEL